MKFPKPYQQATIDTVYKGLNDQGSQFIQGSVGVGKTLISVSIANNWLSNVEYARVLVIVPRVTMTQWCDEFTDQSISHACYYGTQRKASILNTHVCIITTIETLHASISNKLINIETVVKGRTLVIFDEVDSFRNYAKFIRDDSIRQCKRFETLRPLVKLVHSKGGGVLGVTATPVRNAPSDLLMSAWIARQSTKNTLDDHSLDIWIDKYSESGRKDFVDTFWYKVESPSFPKFAFYETQVPWTVKEIVLYREIYGKLFMAYRMLCSHKTKSRSSPDWTTKLHSLQECYFRFSIMLERSMLHPIFASKIGKLSEEEVRQSVLTPSSRMKTVRYDLQHNDHLKSRVLILGKYSEPLRILARYLKNTNRSISQHFGSDTHSQRQTALSLFKKSTDGIFVATWDSFGVGFNLSESNVVYWFNTPKSPGVLTQGNGRVRRPLIQTLHTWSAFYMNAGEKSYDAYILAQYENRLIESCDLVDDCVGHIPLSRRTCKLAEVGMGAMLPSETDDYKKKIKEEIKNMRKEDKHSEG